MGPAGVTRRGENVKSSLQKSATLAHIKEFIDLLLDRSLSPQTINGHLIAIRSFYRYLQDEEQQEIDNPVLPGLSLRLPKPLPRFLQLV